MLELMNVHLIYSHRWYPWTHTHVEGATNSVTAFPPPDFFGDLFFRVSKLDNSCFSILHASAFLLLNRSCPKCQCLHPPHSSSEEVLTIVARALTRAMSSLSGTRNQPPRTDRCCPRRGKARPNGLKAKLSLGSNLPNFPL